MTDDIKKRIFPDGKRNRKKLEDKQDAYAKILEEQHERVKEMRRNKKIIKGAEIEDSLKRNKAHHSKKKQSSKKQTMFDYGIRPSKLEKLKCFPEVVSLIKTGYPATAIAKYIREERKEYTDVSFDAVYKAVRTFIHKMPPGEVIRERLPGYYNTVMNSIEDQIDGVKALSDLFHIQFDRLMIDYQNEKKVNKLIDSNTKNVQAATDIAYKLEEVRYRLVGHHARYGVKVESDKPSTEDQLRDIRGKISQKYGTRMANIASDPIRRRKLLNIFERITNIGEDRFLEVISKYNEDDIETIDVTNTSQENTDDERTEIVEGSGDSNGENSAENGGAETEAT